jgi:hypothetical protein
MWQTILRNRDDFYLPYETYVKARYLAEKRDPGPAHVNRKIEALIIQVLEERLKREADSLQFEYFIDIKARQKAELGKRHQERMRKAYNENYLRRQAKKALVNEKIEELRKEK